MITLILSVFFSIDVSAYDVEVDGIYYNLDPIGNVAEVTNGDYKYVGDITIPSSIKVNDTEYSVTRVQNYAFKNCSRLTSITIPNSVTIVGDSTFCGCIHLQSVNIPSSVTSLGKSTFSGCSSLTSIEIPSNVNYLGNSCFDNCSSLTSINIPSSITSLSGGCFKGCI